MIRNADQVHSVVIAIYLPEYNVLVPLSNLTFYTSGADAVNCSNDINEVLQLRRSNPPTNLLCSFGENVSKIKLIQELGLNSMDFQKLRIVAVKILLTKE